MPVPMPLTLSRRALTRLALPVLPLALLAACGSPAQPVDAQRPGTVIDVRTAEEYTQGHLQGAVNIDVSAPDFDEQVGQLDKRGRYTLYCRSGRRSAQAAERMKQLGFTDVQDAGSYQEATKALGLPEVTG